MWSGSRSSTGRRAARGGAIGLTGGYTVESLVAALPAGATPDGGSAARRRLGLQQSSPEQQRDRRHMAERIGPAYGSSMLRVCWTTKSRPRPPLRQRRHGHYAVLGELRLALVGMSGAPRFAPGYGTVMDRLDPEGRARLAEKGAVGDVAGHLVRIDGSFVQDEWERRTISIPVESLRNVPRVVGIAAARTRSRRSSREQGPGCCTC